LMHPLGDGRSVRRRVGEELKKFVSTMYGLSSQNISRPGKAEKISLRNYE